MRAKAGVERELLIEQAVSREMQSPGLRCQGFDRFLGGVAAQKDSCLGEEVQRSPRTSLTGRRQGFQPQAPAKGVSVLAGLSTF